MNPQAPRSKGLRRIRVHRLEDNRPNGRGSLSAPAATHQISVASMLHIECDRKVLPSFVWVVNEAIG